MTTPTLPSGVPPDTDPPDTGVPETEPRNSGPQSSDASAAATPPEQRERRARTRRSVAMQRATWMAARARNAARRWILIATVGGGAVIATLLVLVLLPREVDRAIRAQLESIPPSRDTMPVLATLQAIESRRVAAEARASELRGVLAARRAPAPGDSGATVASRNNAGRDSLSTDLQQRLTRARVAPLVESYRALAGARLLRDDERVRAIVDSIEQVDREREAYAALGGADARYASLTARLAALGQRVIRIAEQELAASSTSASASPPSQPTPQLPVAPSPAPVAPAPRVTGLPAATDSSRADSAANDTSAAAVAQRAAVATYRLTLAERTASEAALAMADTVRDLQRTLADMRATNRTLDTRRTAIRNRSGISVPPIAMLVASLVVGLALGYASAVIRELRRPTVGDENEVERLAQARVITHSGGLDAVRDARTRRRADRMLPPALDPTAEAWQQLHLTLTGLGDVVRAVRIVSDQPILGSTLAINLAAAAARESRATLIVEPPARTSMLALLLRQTKPRGLNDVQQGRAELREVVTEVPMGRDVAVDVLFSGTATSSAPSVANRSEINEELRRAAGRYDLTLVVGDPAVDIGISSYDIIICARLGSTSLDWMSRTMQQARGGNHRLRAVLLWATEMPSL